MTERIDILYTVGSDEVVTRTLPPFTVAERKARMREQVDALRDGCFAAGFTPGAGPLAGKALQTRGVEDRTNWLTSQAAYSAAVAGGQGAVVGANFRTSGNETITCTYAEGLTALLGMAAWGSSIMGRSWSLKDAIEAAGDDAALNAIDIEAGWP